LALRFRSGRPNIALFKGESYPEDYVLSVHRVQKMADAIETWLSKLMLLVLFPLAVVTCAEYQENKSAKVEGSIPKAQTMVRGSLITVQTPAPRQSEVSPEKVNLSYKDREAWRKIIKWPDSCEEAFNKTMHKATASLEFYELAQKQYLVEVICTLGAYQGFQIYSYLDETKSPPSARLLTLPTYESEDENKLEKKETEELWGVPEFDFKTKQLMILNKFRGLGDCGTLATYGFQRGDVQLKELRAKLTCDGKGAENPKKWGEITPP
jgi:hypothetical protein